MQQFVEYLQSLIIGGLVDRLLVCWLNHLKIPSREVVSEEFEGTHQGIIETILWEVVIYLCIDSLYSGIHPYYRLSIALFLLCISCFPSLNKAESIPHLVTECHTLCTEGIIIENIISCRCSKHHTHTDTISTILGNEVERVRRVAQWLTHLASEFVTYYTCEIYILERYFVLIFTASHYHSCYPEEDDIRTCYKVAGWIVVIYLLIAWVVDTIKERDRPQPWWEPCIEGILVTM